MKRVVIIGSTGLLGESFKIYLSKKYSQIEIVSISSKIVNLLEKGSPSELKKHLKDGDDIVNFAALKKDIGDNFNLLEMNQTITFNIMSAIKGIDLRSFTHISTGGVYGEEINNLSISEETPADPNNYYGLSKITTEKIVEYELLETNTPLTIFRPPLVYGPKDKGDGYGPVGFSKKAVANEEITLWGDGSELREFIYVEDINKILVDSISTLKTGIYNIAAGTKYSFQDVLNILKKKYDLKISQRERSKEKVDNAYNNKKLIEAFGPVEFTSLEDGIDLLLKEYLSE